MADRYLLRLPALEITQGSHRIYVFGIDGKRLEEFTTVSRVRRDDSDALEGYQRPEAVSHIRAIRRYLESDGAMLPNALVLAFTDQVRFEACCGERLIAYSVPGELIIPVDESLHEVDKPAWLVDGQQRSAAIRDADVADFPVATVGFIASSEEEQRSQFILVNNTKPLPSGLIHELLPETTGELPARYARRRLPAYLMARLNIDQRSPFRGLIATPTTAAGYIKDNSVLKMIENSLYEGALYQYRDPRTGTGDTEQMFLHLTTFWCRVRATWPAAWELPPRKSRLTHGVGIQALGYIMDILADEQRAPEISAADLDRSLDALESVAAWTSGTWSLAPGDERRWNGLQNTPNDVRRLTNLFVQTLRRAH